MENKAIPEMGKTYCFFDDGKISETRMYGATITDIIPYDQACKVLTEVQQKAHERLPELFAETTDYFVGASIPVYDEFTIWFVRATNGGWFSLSIQHTWQSGRLDIDGDLVKSIYK